MAEITNTKNVAELEYKYILLASYLMHTDLEGNAFKFRFSDVITFLNGVYATKAEMTTALAQLSQYTTKGYVDSLVGQSAKKTYVDAKDAEILRLIDGINKGSLNVYPTDSPSNGIDVYNALVAGTYTNFGGFVVTPEEIGSNLVRLIRRKGVWEKILVAIPLTGFAPVFSNDLNSTTSGRKLMVSVGADGKYHLSNILDQYTGGAISATETGSGVTVENIIYFEYAGKKYKRDIDGLVCPEWFGAKGDGITDDTIAIQKALDFSKNVEDVSKKGLNLKLGRAVYIVSGLTIPARASITGEGIGASILKLKNGGNKDVIFVPKTAFHVVLRDFSIDGNNPNNTFGYGIATETNTNADGYDAAIQYDKSIERASSYRFLSLININVSRAAQDGVRFNGASYLCYINRLHVDYNNGYGFYNAAPDNVEYSGITAERNGLSGINAGGNNCRWDGLKSIWNNTSFTPGHGGITMPSNRSLFSNVECQDNFGDGYIINGAQSLSLINCLSDGNGYDASLLGDGVSVGYRIINSRQITFKNASTDNYLGIRSNGRLVQEKPYDIDLLSNDVNVSEIRVNRAHNKSINQREEGSPTIPKILTNRNTDYVGTSKTFIAGEPILENGVLRFTAQDQINVPCNFIANDAFTISAIMTIATKGPFARLVHSMNGNFFIQLSTYSVTSESIDIYVRCNGVLKNINLEIPNNLFPINVEFRLAITVQKRGDRLHFFLAFSYFSDANQRIINTIVMKNVVIGISDKIDVIDTLRLFNAQTDKMSGTISEFFITPDTFREQDLLIGGTNSNIKNYYCYLDFSSMPAIIENKSSYLPVASSYYAGREIWINGGVGVADVLYRCAKNSSNAYVWEPVLRQTLSSNAVLDIGYVDTINTINKTCFFNLAGASGENPFAPFGAAGYCVVDTGGAYGYMELTRISTSVITKKRVRHNNVWQAWQDVYVQPLGGSASAAFQINSTTQGVMLPGLTTTQRDAIASPPERLEIYNTTLKKKQFYNGTVWETLTST